MTQEDRAEETIRRAGEITKLREQLAEREASFRLFLTGGDKRQTTEEFSRSVRKIMTKAHEAASNSAASRIREHIRARAGQTFLLLSMRNALPNIDPKLVRSTTHRLATDPKYGMPGLKSVGRGKYRYDPAEGPSVANGQTTIPTSPPLFPTLSGLKKREEGVSR